MTAPETLATPGRMRNRGGERERERERGRGRTHPDFERIPSTRRVCVCESTNPIIDENSTDRLKERSSLRPCEKMCINISREYWRARRRFHANIRCKTRRTNRRNRTWVMWRSLNFPIGSISKEPAVRRWWTPSLEN